MVLRLIFLFFPLSIILSAQTDHPYNYKLEKRATGYQGMVVSAHPLASAAGIEILQAGGNGDDASIAVQLALAVVYPQAGNIGGGGFFIAQLANGKTLAFDFRETASGDASRDMYLNSQGDPEPDKSLFGGLASGIPGTIAGLYATHAYGNLPMRKLFEPAIRLASEGFALTERDAKNLNQSREKFIKYNACPVAFVKKEPWKKNDSLIQPELSATLIRIAEKGPQEFYQGYTAQKIFQTITETGGIITMADLKNYQAKERRIEKIDYQQYSILTMPLPSSGGIILKQLLGIMEMYPLKEYGFHSLQAVHLMAEAERRSYADRAHYLGDPDFVSVPVNFITDKKYLRERMAGYSPSRASKSEDIDAGTYSESEETTHLSVIDREGNAVSVTTTLNGGYGSFVVVKDCGFILNNEMDDFSIKPGYPNMYGALGSDANAIAPGKRMLSSMTPVIVVKKGKPYLIAGSPGGTTIPTTVFQIIVNILEFGMSLEEAVNSPRFHHQWKPDYIRVEPDFPESLRKQLSNYGHSIKESGTIGRVDAIMIHPDRMYEGVGDRRGDDAACGF